MFLERNNWIFNKLLQLSDKYADEWKSIDTVISSDCIPTEDLHTVLGVNLDLVESEQSKIVEKNVQLDVDRVMREELENLRAKIDGEKVKYILSFIKI
ncbi:MAG: IQ and AAA domain-containing protein 1-like [Paramarteilia canceri]